MAGRQIKVSPLEKSDSSFGPVSPKRIEPKLSDIKPHASAADTELSTATPALVPLGQSTSPRILSRESSVAAGGTRGGPGSASASGSVLEGGGGSRASDNVNNSNSCSRVGTIMLGDGEDNQPRTALTLHTAAQSQEFSERANSTYQITQMDRDADADFFLSLSTTLRKEAKLAPYKRDGHPLMLAAAADNKGSNTGATVSSIDIQMILEELGPLESVTQVYARDYYGRTPLHLAAMNGCADTIYQLLNTYRKSMYRTAVLDNIAKLERERSVSEAELKAALIKGASDYACMR